MNTLISCKYNMDTACVELKYSDGTMISIDTIAVENEVADNMYQWSELDCGSQPKNQTLSAVKLPGNCVAPHKIYNAVMGALDLKRTVSMDLAAAQPPVTGTGKMRRLRVNGLIPPLSGKELRKGLIIPSRVGLHGNLMLFDVLRNQSSGEAGVEVTRHQLRKAETQRHTQEPAPDRISVKQADHHIIHCQNPLKSKPIRAHKT